MTISICSSPNGNPDDLIETLLKDVIYRWLLLLFHSDGKTLHNVSAESGPILAKDFPQKVLAIGDFDDDGAVDVLVFVGDAPPLLRNTAVKGNRRLGLKLVGRKANRDAVGARISYQTGTLERSGMKVGGGSFCCHIDAHRAHVGVWVAYPRPRAGKIVWFSIDTPILHAEEQIRIRCFQDVVARRERARDGVMARRRRSAIVGSLVIGGTLIRMA